MYLQRGLWCGPLPPHFSKYNCPTHGVQLEMWLNRNSQWKGRETYFCVVIDRCQPQTHNQVKGAGKRKRRRHQAEVWRRWKLHHDVKFFLHACILQISRSWCWLLFFYAHLFFLLQLNPWPGYIAERLSLYEKLKEESDALLAEKATNSKPITVELPDGRKVQGKSWVTTPYQVASSIR